LPGPAGRSAGAASRPGSAGWRQSRTYTQWSRARRRLPGRMHGTALSRAQWWTRPGCCTGSRALKNWLSRHRPSGCGSSWSPCLGCRRGGPGRRLIHRARPGLRHNHPRRRPLRPVRCCRLRAHHGWRGGGGRWRRHRNSRSGGLRGWWRCRTHYRRGGRNNRRCRHRRCRPDNGSCRHRRRNWGSHNRNLRSRGRFCRLGLCRRMDNFRARTGWRRGCRSLLFANRVQNIAGPGNMREVDLGLDFIRMSGADTPRFRGRMNVTRGGAKVRPHFLCLVLLNRTGVRLFLADTNFLQHIENRLALDFQFSGQIVDSNLAHPPLFPPNLSR